MFKIATSLPIPSMDAVYCLISQEFYGVVNICSRPRTSGGKLVHFIWSQPHGSLRTQGMASVRPPGLSLHKTGHWQQLWYDAVFSLNY